ncbi:sulfite exporter TauE/SafE family protein [Clostridium estertheticum]|uniref:sulfite exporter TauE/SafE family protein n=1 Tax=Clostridium estertheticum TaxID=238834 RepID=UPI0013E9021C|nr:sulfite exporter TauE/SafE family protein [Clostridium estertheticum]MBZ9686498.1 sulfite exporter TauE/SafE family protein [Clostridium estertheticum]
MTSTILFILIGIVAGVLSGMFGIGGGVIIVPALMFLCGFSQLKAQGTSLAILLPPVGIIAFMEYYKKGQVNVKAGLLIVIFLVIGSVFGSKLAQNIPTEVLKKGFGILMLLISLKMIFSK